MPGPRKPRSGRAALTPEDAAIWARVKETVRPLQKPRPVIDLPTLKASTAPRPVSVEPPSVSVTALRAPVGSASLDGGWDRRARTGNISIDRTIDLHGLGREEAFQRLSRAIMSAAGENLRTLLVITGKGKTGKAWPEMRGVLRDALADWLEVPALRPFVAALRQAHPRHGGSGAFYVILRRRRPGSPRF